MEWAFANLNEFTAQKGVCVSERGKVELFRDIYCEKQV